MTPTPAIDLRRIRFERGLLLRDVAEAVDISATYLSLIERREVTPRGPIAARIAEFYALQVAEIWPPEAAAA